MKRLFNLFLALLLTAAASAETISDAASELVYETLSDTEVKVTGMIDSSSEIVIPKTVTHNGKTYTVVEIGAGAFLNKREVLSVSLAFGNAVATISPFAFKGCQNLEQITGGSQVTEVGENAFDGCQSLTLATFERLRTIGKAAFAGCRSLSNFPLYAVNTIGEEAFSGCTAITDLTIPEQVLNVGAGAYQGCSGLKQVHWLTEAVEDYTSVEASPFYAAGCTLEQITYGRRIPAYLFYGVPFANKSLTPGKFTFTGVSIGDFAFSESSFTELTFMNCTIGAHAFENNYSLSRVELYGTMAIGDQAFASDYLISTLLSGCTTPPTLGEDVFAYTDVLVSFTQDVTNEQRDAYAADRRWNDLLAPFTLNVKVYNDAGAHVSGSGTYRMGSSATLLASMDNFFEFQDWVISGRFNEPLSTEDSIKVLINHDFKDLFGGKDEGLVLARVQPSPYTLRVSYTDDIAGGRVEAKSSNGFRYGDVVTLTAIPYVGYDFVAWDDGSTETERTITVDWTTLSTRTEEGTYRPLESASDFDPKAEYVLSVGLTFQTDELYFKIKMTPSEQAGTIRCTDDQGKVHETPLYALTASGGYAYFTPQANAGYVFDHWEWAKQADGSNYSSRVVYEDPRTHQLSIRMIWTREDPFDDKSPLIYQFPTELTAVFKAETVLKVDIQPGPEAGTIQMTDEKGRTHANGLYLQDNQETAILTPVPAEGYSFERWEYKDDFGVAVEENMDTHVLTVYLLYSSDGRLYFPTTYTAIFRAPDGIAVPVSVQPATYYNADGRRISQPGRGITIVRRADGTTVKVAQRAS